MCGCPKACSTFATSANQAQAAFAAGQIAQVTLSFDSPLTRLGVLEIAGVDVPVQLPEERTPGR